MEIRVEITGIDEVIRQLNGLVSEAALQQGLAAAAFYVEEQAKVKAPIDFGFLRNSIYTVTARGSGYGRAAAEAKAANTKARMLPEVAPPGRLEAIVAVGADYGIYQEMGTRFMRAQPFMRPAVENNRERIAGIIRDALQRRAR